MLLPSLSLRTHTKRTQFSPTCISLRSSLHKHTHTHTSLALVECYLFRKDKVATAAAFVRFFLSAWAALVVTGFMTEARGLGGVGRGVQREAA